MSGVCLFLSAELLLSKPCSLFFWESYTASLETGWYLGLDGGSWDSALS
jgi:hypothetical protein